MKGILIIITIGIISILFGVFLGTASQQYNLWMMLPMSMVLIIRENTGIEIIPFVAIDLVEKRPENETRSPPVSFSVYFNGDGLSESVLQSSSDFSGINQVILQFCPKLDEVKLFSRHDNIVLKRICDPQQGARLYGSTGKRIFSFHDVKDGERLYVVPQGLHFVWPTGVVGSTVYPENVRSPIPEKPIRMKLLSISPLVYSIENFISKEEMDSIISHNVLAVKPSEVGFAGMAPDRSRNSSTSWDTSSWGSRRMLQRAFDIASLNTLTTMTDTTQVLRYRNTEWYKPHCDWFEGHAFDGHDPTVNNGTNRFATVFVYLSDVEEGGHTVFPYSKSHEGYNGGELTPKSKPNCGFTDEHSRWVCDVRSDALRSKPTAGNALIFYNQLPNSTLDYLSLHGGCPVIKGTKWSANVWLWNRPKPDKERDAKDGKYVPESAVTVKFTNKRTSAIHLLWDAGIREPIFQFTIEPSTTKTLHSYVQHRFIAKDAETLATVGYFMVKASMRNQYHTFVIE